ncbi:efflux transporter outer membrane subunit [Pseudoruegeria sp. SK021]|uniref:efflux transporter outer membrane subunit n=1 Tax=Pseudoruegeria sp. SK021 TaxID=1933035 RepID=UPI000A250373|nr:efflux transporter outer membrane subunit [Pseudoruegeria sp. SK021]OSP55951.1 transporter [Pseudoruegeria sp. SK021]
MALTLAGALAACTPVGPNFARPNSPVVQQWMELNAPQPSGSGGLTARSAPSVAWWQTFKDPTLNKLVAQAYAQNLSLQVAGARVLQARAQLGIAYGDMFPQSQAAGASYSRRKISDNIGNLPELENYVDVDTTFTSAQVGFDAQWELDVWGGQRRGVESASANLAAKVASYDDALVTLTGDVASVYINIRALQETLAVARQNIALQQKGLDLTDLRFKNGVTTELDVQESTALLNNTKALIPALESDLQQAKNALSVLLGQPPSAMSDLLKGSGRIPSASSRVAVGVPAELLRRRPDIRAAELTAAAQSAQIGVAVSYLYPQFILSGSIGVQASPGNPLFSTDSVTGLASPGVVWNIFNYGRIKDNVRVQDAAFQELVANYQNTVLSAYAEVENAMVGYQKANQEVGFLQTSVGASQRAAEIALDQYGDGVVDYTRVLNTQQGLLRAQANLITARAAASTNLVALYKGLGGGWQVRKNQEFLPEAVLAEMAYRTDWGDLLQATPTGMSLN